MTTQRSVLVVGGGPVGLLQAVLLSQDQRLQVTLVEPGAKPAPMDEQRDLRVYALSRASQRVLESIQAWSSIPAARRFAYRRMVVWEDLRGPDHPGALVFDSEMLGEPDLGHIVEDRVLRIVLGQTADRCANLNLEYGVAVERLRPLDGGIEIELSDGRQSCPSLVVAADGSDSPIREHLKTAVTRWSYRQRAIVAHVKSERPHSDTAWQRFLTTGPVALLPMANGISGLVWSLDDDQANRIEQLGREEFQEQLGAATGRVIGDLTLSGARASFPLQFIHANRYSVARVVLVGDAAHTVHPLAGQGLNLGILDAASLAEIVSNAVDRGHDPGDLPVLRRYERWRKPANLAMAASLEALHRLFKLPAPAAPLRRLGLELVARSTAARRLFMARALGLSGDLPGRARVA